MAKDTYRGYLESGLVWKFWIKDDQSQIASEEKDKKDAAEEEIDELMNQEAYDKYLKEHEEE